MYRFNPKVKEAIDKVKHGKLGRIYSVEAQMSCTHTKDIREWLANFPGGMLFFLGCHLIDIIYTIQGNPDEIIPLSCSTGIEGVASNDFGMAVFKYKTGVSFAKTCDVECGGFLRRHIVIAGERGTIEINPIEAYEGNYMYSESKVSHGTGWDWHTPWEESRSELFDRYDATIRNFAEMVRGKENPYSYDYEMNLYELVLKACGKDV